MLGRLGLVRVCPCLGDSSDLDEEVTKSGRGEDGALSSLAAFGLIVCMRETATSTPKGEHIEDPFGYVCEQRVSPRAARRRGNQCGRHDE